MTASEELCHLVAELPYRVTGAVPESYIEREMGSVSSLSFRCNKLLSDYAAERDALLRLLTQTLEADDRIAAAWLWGSLPSTPVKRRRSRWTGTGKLPRLPRCYLTPRFCWIVWGCLTAPLPRSSLVHPTNFKWGAPGATKAARGV